MKLVFPWTDSEGKLLSKTKLKAASKKWSPEIWEAYLQTLEHNEPNVVYTLSQGNIIEELATEDFSSLVSESKPIDKNLSKEIREAVNRLSPRKKSIIRSTYWNGISERDQAEKIGIHRRSVSNQKRKAKQQLKKILLNDSMHLPKLKQQK